MISGSIRAAVTLYSVLLIETNTFPIVGKSNPEMYKSLNILIKKAFFNKEVSEADKFFSYSDADGEQFLRWGDLPVREGANQFIKNMANEYQKLHSLPINLTISTICFVAMRYFKSHSLLCFGVTVLISQIIRRALFSIAVKRAMNKIPLGQINEVTMDFQTDKHKSVGKFAQFILMDVTSYLQDHCKALVGGPSN